MVHSPHLGTLELIFAMSPGSEMTPWGSLSQAPTCDCTSVPVAYYGTVLYFYLCSLSPAPKMRPHRFKGQPPNHLTAHATTAMGSLNRSVGHYCNKSLGDNKWSHDPRTCIRLRGLIQRVVRYWSSSSKPDSQTYNIHSPRCEREKCTARR